MKINNGVFILIGLIMTACGRDYDCNELEFKNGLKYEKKSGDLANGKLKCTEDRDGRGYIHEELYEYKNGRRVGSWEYKVQGDVIHHGEILNNKKLQALISERFKADYIELELWWEGKNNHLDLSVINARKDLDSTKIQSLIDNELKELMEENNLDVVSVQVFKNWSWNNSRYFLTKSS